MYIKTSQKIRMKSNRSPHILLLQDNCYSYIYMGFILIHNIYKKKNPPSKEEKKKRSSVPNRANQISPLTDWDSRPLLARNSKNLHLGMSKFKFFWSIFTSARLISPLVQPKRARNSLKEKDKWQKEVRVEIKKEVKGGRRAEIDAAKARGESQAAA